MQTLIEQLNHVARSMVDDDTTPTDALAKTAHLFMLVEVETSGESRIYEAADGTLINCWLGGAMSEEIKDGGLGFDDQIEWFVDDLITQAEAAEIVNVTTQAIHNAIRDGRLRGYKNPNAKRKRQGATLVSRSEVEKRF
jgi:hypothetical protein